MSTLPSSSGAGDPAAQPGTSADNSDSNTRLGRSRTEPTSPTIGRSRTEPTSPHSVNPSSNLWGPYRRLSKNKGAGDENLNDGDGGANTAGGANNAGGTNNPNGNNPNVGGAGAPNPFLSTVCDRIYNHVKRETDGMVNIIAFLRMLEAKGILRDDPRISGFISVIKSAMKNPEIAHLVPEFSVEEMGREVESGAGGGVI